MTRCERSAAINKHVEFTLDAEEEARAYAAVRGAVRGQPESRLARAIRGGAIDEARRLPRYVAIMLLGLAMVWAPISLYLTHAPKTWSAGALLILPGAGASASVNLSEIGQASSAAASPFSSSAVSPTVTYKALLGSYRVRERAAREIGAEIHEMPKPRVKLTDQTSLIRFDVKAGEPARAAQLATALLAAFLAELEALRVDEVRQRGDAVRASIADFQASVDQTRAELTRLKSESGLYSSDQYERHVEEADRLETRLRDIEAELARRTRALGALTAALELDRNEAARFLRLRSDPEFLGLIEAMAVKSAEAASARTLYGPNHPIRVEIQTALNGARARARARAAALTGIPEAEVERRVDFSGTGERGALMAEIVRVSGEAEGLEAERAALAEELTAARDRARRLVSVASALDDLGRDYQVAEAVFATALARTDTSKSDVYASYPLVQVLEPPSPPEEPSSPHVLLALAGGAAATLMLIVALILGWIRRPLIDRLLPRDAA